MGTAVVAEGNARVQRGEGEKSDEILAPRAENNLRGALVVRCLPAPARAARSPSGSELTYMNRAQTGVDGNRRAAASRVDADGGVLSPADIRKSQRPRTHSISSHQRADF